MLWNERKQHVFCHVARHEVILLLGVSHYKVTLLSDGFEFESLDDINRPAEFSSGPFIN